MKVKSAVKGMIKNLFLIGLCVTSAFSVTLTAQAKVETQSQKSNTELDQLFHLFPGNALQPQKKPVLVAASSFGTQVGSYNGISAYSNGSTSYVSPYRNSYNSYDTGIKWQCVEYVNRFFKAMFNREVRGGNANTYYANAYNKGLNRAPNGGTNGPRAGNIICSNGGSYGHCAIIREVGPNYVQVIEQNFFNSGLSPDRSNFDRNDNFHKLSMNVSNGRYYVGAFSSTYPVVGWMWPR